MDSVVVFRLEVVETGRRRRWIDAEKLRIVAERMAGSRLVSATARRRGISRWQLNTWRRQVREVGLVGDEALAGPPRLCRDLTPVAHPASTGGTRAGHGGPVLQDSRQTEGDFAPSP